MIVNYLLEKSTLDYLDEKTKALLKKLELEDRQSVQALISGQPLNLWRSDGTEEFFDECAEIVEVPLQIGRVSLLHIDPIIYRHQPERYLSAEGYATLQAYDDSGNEYRMGILDVLGFEIREITD